MRLHTGQQLQSSCSLLTVITLFTLLVSTASAAVLGIDFGTEYIKAALVKPGIPLDIVLTRDSKRKEAAAVAYKPIKQKSSSVKGIFPERAYGSDAVALSARFPTNSFLNVKSLLAVPVTDEAVIRYRRRYPGVIIEAQNNRDTVALRAQTFEDDESPFAIEELIAMQLENVVANAEAATGTKLRDVVITVPAYWTVEEKDALRSAADLVGVKILSMTTDGLAVGINYAMTKKFPVVNDGSKSRPEYHIVYDMGAGGTSATVLRMQARNVKDVGRFNKTVQEVQVAGVGWDKVLGGDALNTMILEDMVNKLADNAKIKALGADRDAITKDPRTISKLWRESERLRQVLSANTETSTSFEGIFNEDVSFKYKLTRAQFREMADQFAQIVRTPIDQAMHSARLEFSDIDSIIVHGGAQRTPFVQDALESWIGNAEKVRNNVNSDEAAAFGAAFLGAGLSPTFRVKEIRSSEASVHDVWISWEQEGKQKKQKIFTDVSKSGAPKQIPFKKLEDFDFEIFQQVLDGDNMRNIPVWSVRSTNLTQAVQALTEKNECPIDEVKTHFELSMSAVDNLPEVLRGSVSCEVVDTGKKGGIVDGIKGFFGGKKDEQKVMQADTEADAADPSIETAEGASLESTVSSSTHSSVVEPEQSSEPKKKTVQVFVGVKQDGSRRKKQLSQADFKSFQDRLKAFKKSDRNRAKRSEALNQLEGYTYRVRDILDNEDFIKASTEQQRSDISAKSSDASEWLYGEGSEASTAEFEKRLKDLKALVDPVEKRKKEAAVRPELVEMLEETIESTRKMLETMKEGAEKALEDYESSVAAASATSSATSTTTSTIDELDALDDETSTSTVTATAIPSPVVKPDDLDPAFETLEEAQAWLKEKIAAQSKLHSSDDPILLAQDLKNEQSKLSKITTDLLQKHLRAQEERERKERMSSKKANKSKSKTKSSKTTAKTSSGSSTTSGSDPASTKDEL